MGTFLKMVNNLHILLKIIKLPKVHLLTSADHYSHLCKLRIMNLEHVKLRIEGEMVCKGKNIGR